ncbi:GNAT family N-acetyltransferase [Chloroflexus sp.]|uniref:GNAT family N-acetyltransferase n=1 Tax=Chloroflexus sp. TaxID=1904827 RepID=UPI002ACEE9BC|nr:GNAT family N-acetyltransferase [Chloroflexus sp.]
MFTFAQAYPHEITLWVVELDSQVVGGRLAFYWNQHVTLWNGTATRDALARRALFVLDVEIIRDAIARGLSFFDFNTSAGIEGVMQYKRHFATTDYIIARCEYRSPMLQPLVQLAHRLQRQAVTLQRVPALTPDSACSHPLSSNPTQCT